MNDNEHYTDDVLKSPRISWRQLDEIKAIAFREGMKLGRDFTVLRILNGTPPRQVKLWGIEDFNEDESYET